MTDQTARDNGTGSGYVSSLAPRWHPLVTPGPAPSRWAELRAVLGWTITSWRRPADTPAAWQQRPGQEHDDEQKTDG